MDKIINDIMLALPQTWKPIKPEEYGINKVYASDLFEVVGAFEVDGEIVAINLYPEMEGFVEAYDQQIAQISQVLKDKQDWKAVSTIKPVKFKYLKNTKHEKVYLCVFETYNVSQKVSVQIFLEKGDRAIGFVTSVREEKEQNILETVKQNPTVKQILAFLSK